MSNHRKPPHAEHAPHDPNPSDSQVFFTRRDRNAAVLRDALQHGDWLQSEILKIGHHGADNATSNEWISMVQPHVAITSASDHGGFFHPRRSVLERTEKSPKLKVTHAHSLTAGHEKKFTTNEKYTKAIYNTHDSGTVVITSTGSRYRFRRSGEGATMDVRCSDLEWVRTVPM